MKGCIYLIPTTLGDANVDKVIPVQVAEIIKSIKVFIVEDLRSARRYLKMIDKSFDIDSLTFFELNKHTNDRDKASFVNPAMDGVDVGIISEAGCPGIADPGADIVSLAHFKGIRVIPLVGPSSILMSLMASGMNGQSFAFNGYLPIKQGERVKRIKQLEQRSQHENQSQSFIEAPYRNNQMLDDILKSCKPQTRVCIACDISLDSEFIKTLTVKQWQTQKPNLHKRLVVFVING